MTAHENPNELYVPSDWPSLLDSLNQTSSSMTFNRYNHVLSEIGSTSRLRVLAQQPLIPGNFQNRAYIDRLFKDHNLAPAERVRQAAFRLGRGSLILESNASQEYIISEPALGGAGVSLVGREILQQQLADLSHIAQTYNNIDIRVLPEAASASPATDTVELFYARPDSPGNGFISSHFLACMVEATDLSIPPLENVWERVWDQALPADESQRRIDAAIANLG